MAPPVTKHSTSQQVAKKAGVSRSTVSLILNKVPGMKFSEETCVRVLQAALELGYVRDAVRHLIDLGHQRIAHITFAPEGYGSSDRRLASYRRTLQDGGLSTDPALVRRGNYSAASGFAAMCSLLAERPYPTALFAGNDTLALGALVALYQHGLRVPEDLAVVGYDDIPTAAYAVPPLTTVHAPATEQGRLAGEMVLDLIEGRPVGTPRILLETELVVRTSCGARRATLNQPGEKHHV
jgi:LacI family transcriptional regulator